MIIGDPSRFAIFIDWVPAWWTEEYGLNGAFHYVVNGEFYPRTLAAAPLSGEVYGFENGNSIVMPPEDGEIFIMPKDSAFRVLMEKIFPDYFDPDVEISDDFVTDFSFKASTDEMENSGCFFFAVSSKGVTRILGARLGEFVPKGNGESEWVVFESPDICETMLSDSEVLKLVEGVKSAWNDIEARVGRERGIPPQIS